MALVITHPINVDMIIRSRPSTDKKGNGFSSHHAGLGGIAFDPWTAVAGSRINGMIFKYP
jgi:hypothetical protein